MSEVITVNKLEAVYSLAMDMAQNVIGQYTIGTLDFHRLAEQHFGCTTATGLYDRTDMYNAMELAFNMYLYLNRNHFGLYGNHRFTTEQSVEKGIKIYRELRDAGRHLPTQTVRSEDQLDFQQFSTPPHLAYLAAWVADLQGSDLVLEPSAGLGGLAIHAFGANSGLVVNELEQSRFEILEGMFQEHDKVQVFNHDAEVLHAFEPQIRPSVVLMNPPFTSNGATGYKSKFIGFEHMKKALSMVQNSGRVVCILYGGRPNFKGDQGGVSMYNPDYLAHWKELQKTCSIRANVSFPGSEYMKYGTGINTRLIVIDKGRPQMDETIQYEFKDNADIEENFFRIMAPVMEARFDKDVQLKNEEPAEQKVVSTFTRRDVMAELMEKAPEQFKGMLASPNIIIGSMPKLEVKEVPLPPCEVAREALEQEEAPVLKLNPEYGTHDFSIPEDDNAPFTMPASTDFANEPVAEPVAEPVLDKKPDTPVTDEVTDDDDMGSMFQAYKPYLTVTGTKGHPSPLVESDALSMVKPPKIKTKVRLPFQAVRDGKISDVQIEAVALALDSCSRTVPGTNTRRSFILGQGTGFGKGTTLATTAMSYWLAGARRILWISKSGDLIADARRDWKWIGGNEKDIFLLNNEKNSVIQRDGILFATYNTLGMEQKAVQGDKDNPERAVMKGIDRLEQVLGWKPDLIMADESHMMANSLGESAADMAVRSMKLMESLPEVPVVMASATAATEVHNLAYATDRLGLSGPQMSAFPTKHAFISKIGSAGMLAMELVAKDMKTMGNYMSQNLSYNGTTFRMLEHTLTPNQVEQYNTAAEAWRLVMAKMNQAIALNHAEESSRAKALIASQFYSAMQRFFNQLLTSMKTPTTIRDMEKALETGHACVIQLVNTNEAATGRAVAEAEAAGLSLDEMDISPKDTLIGLIKGVFPVVQHQYSTNEKGKTVSIPVKDKDGKFVLNPDAVEMRDDLIRRVADLNIPEGALDMIINHFGHQHVAEISGRKERYITAKGRNQGDLGVNKIRQARSKNSCNAEALEFNDGKRLILIFSGAGNTGRSMHSDKRFKNQRRRMHYVLQPGWRADEALQGLGRTHRTNQANAPEYVLPTTNLKGEKRFITSIARRIEQLGSLTKGNRKAASGGLFSADDNLESEYATKATHLFFNALKANAVEGLALMEVATQMGLRDMVTEDGQIIQKKVPKTTRFLNRILCLNTDVQDQVFDAWFGFMLDLIEKAKEAGTFDKGVEKINAFKITKVSETEVYTDPETKAVTKIVELQTLDKTRFVTLGQAEGGMYVADNLGGFSQTWREEFYAYVKHTLKAGPHAGEVRVAAVHKGIGFDAGGNIKITFRKISPFGAVKIPEAEYMAEKNERITKAEAQKLWEQSVNEAPEWESQEIYLLTGALLPIWDKIPNDKARIVAAETTSKERFLGRVIEPENLHALLNNLGALTEGEYYTPEQLIEFVMKKDAKLHLANKWKIQKRRTGGSDRLIITNIGNNEYLAMRDSGHLKYEFFNGINLYYIPLDGNEVEHFKAITASRRVAQMDRNGVITTLLDEPKPVKEEVKVLVEEPEFYNIDHLIELYDMETGKVRPITDLLLKHVEEVVPASADLFTAPAPEPKPEPKAEPKKKEPKFAVVCPDPNLIPITELPLPSEKKKAVAPEQPVSEEKPLSQKEKLDLLIKKAHLKNASIDPNKRKPRKVVELEAAGQMSLF